MTEEAGGIPPEKPSCFADLDTVFPMAEDGLRVSPEGCLRCREKTDCLKTALSGKGGLVTAGEKLDRAYESGQIGFAGRWAQKKQLARKQQDSQAGIKGWIRRVWGG